MSTLLYMPVGASGRILGLNASGASRRRFLDMGLTPGASVSCLFSAPSGDPKAYAVRGAVLALRNDDAGLICLNGFN